MEGTSVKIVCIDRTGTPRYNITGVNDAARVAKTLRSMPGIGQPFLVFPDVGWAAPTLVDFDQFPDFVVSADESANVAMIETMLAAPPTSALTW